MARLKLKTKPKDPPKPKEPKQLTIKKTAGKSGYVFQHDPDSYPLLMDNRCEEEKFSRVDRYCVNHYYLVGTEWLCEKIFYPSGYGFEMIEKEGTKGLKALVKRLRDDGIGLWGERPVPKIEVPTKRLKLKCKPKRMRLTCKEK